jgi:hypothetical protein
MSKEKTKKNQWGGARKGAGHPWGKNKAKICVSVDQGNWNSALKLWRKKPSWLVDSLVSSYLSAGPAILEMASK